MIYLIEQNYLILLALLAICFSLISQREDDKKVWFTLGILQLFLWLNKSYFPNNESTLYYVRSCLTFVTALYFLIRLTLNKLAFYQATVLALLLVCYGYVEYEVQHGGNLRFYDHYEAIIYGLVTAQYFAIFTQLWSRYNRNGSNSIVDSDSNTRVKK